MTKEEILLRRLSGQHLPTPTDTQTAVRDLCGVQSQFLSHALHGLRIRCREVDLDGLVKSWTIRGTMHLFSVRDLPLFLHKGRGQSPRPVDTMDGDDHITAQRKAHFADIIVRAIGDGTQERESLKILCEKAGMTEEESQSLFDPWGGIIRALCADGRICHRVQEKKAYCLCPPFTPMEEEPARLELARRYFTHFAPATVKDAAYFFHTTQSRVRSWLERLPVTETVLNGRAYYYIETGEAVTGHMPECLFLAGFDQLLLGHEKTESLILPREHLREVFNLAGIVRPAVLVHGQVVGWWNKKDRKLTVMLFAPAEHEIITASAERLWGDVSGVEIEHS